MASNHHCVLTAAVALTVTLSPWPGFAQNQASYYMDIVNAKTSVPAGGAKGNKTARLTGRVTISDARPADAKLPGVRFELRDQNGKVAAARVVTGPIKSQNNAKLQAGQAAIEFDAAIYGFAPEPGERYMLRGMFPSGQFFGKPVRFEKSADPLPEEPWEEDSGAKPGKPKKPNK